jgi:hypothetical protein
LRPPPGGLCANGQTPPCTATVNVPTSTPDPPPPPPPPAPPPMPVPLNALWALLLFGVGLCSLAALRERHQRR